MYRIITCFMLILGIISLFHPDFSTQEALSMMILGMLMQVNGSLEEIIKKKEK